MATSLSFRSGLPVAGSSNLTAASRFLLRDGGVAVGLLEPVDAIARRVSAARTAPAQRAWECEPAQTIDSVLAELLLATVRTKP